MENELRLGNAFCQKGSDFVEYVTFETFELLSRKAIIIEPIPLTEKWLLKFGFQKLIDTNYFRKKYCVDGFDYMFEINIDSKYQIEIEYSIGVKMLYLHQLQNLYFALTGEELKLNEK